MELRQLKYFIHAAELENFTDAAAASFITQSTLSQQIKQLEDELHLPLFDRVARRVRLTEAGKTFLPYARKTVKDAEDGKEMLKDLMDLKWGTLTIGATYGLSYLLTKAVGDFSWAYPAIKLQMRFGTTQELLQQLHDGKIDLMLSYHEGKHTETLFSSCLALIVHTSHTIAVKNKVSLQELASLALLLPAKGYSIRNYFDQVLQTHGLTPDVRMEVNDVHTLLQLVQTGRWATVLMGSSVFNHAELKAIKITGAAMSRLATITWPVDAYRKQSALELAKLLKIHAVNYHVEA